MPPLLTVGEYTHVAPDAFVRGTRFACVANECIRRYVSKHVADATPHASLTTIRYLTAYSFTPTLNRGSTRRFILPTTAGP